MRKLVDFLIKQRHWFLFLLLEIISFSLIYLNNSYQRSLFINTSNIISDKVFHVSAKISEYFQLKEINKTLLKEKGLLELKVLDLQEQNELITKTDSSFLPNDSLQKKWEIIPATVVNNSISELTNYITIDKGEADGIQRDMGVMSASGVVGIVYNVSQHYAVVIPILNNKFRLSCSIARTNHFGTMQWKGRSINHATLTGLPLHIKFEVGDSIITSGYSAIFPKGMFVGLVESFDTEYDKFYELQIKLGTHFERLHNVYILKNNFQAEQLALEKKEYTDD